MRLSGKSRVGITLTLGLLAGILLVMLPGILAPLALNSGSTGSETHGPASTFTAGSSTSRNNQPTTTTPTVSPVAGIVIVTGLVLLPAITLSVLVRHWTLKRARNKLASD